MRSTQLKCYRCGKEYEVTDMRYTATKSLICKNCMEKGKHPLEAASNTEQKSTITGFQLKKEAPKKLNIEKEQQVEYLCSNCHYSFKRKKSAKITACPYCGTEGTLDIKSEMTADKIIKESMGE